MKKIKVCVLSSLAKNSGCWLRAGYLADSLKKNASVQVIEPMTKSLPFMLDMIISIPLNIFKVLFSNADFFIGIKPFPNVTFPLLLAKMLKGKTIAVDIDDVDFGYREGFLSKISSSVQKPFPRYFDTVTYHNELLKSYMIKEFGVDKSKMYKLDQGVDLKLFNPALIGGDKNLMFYMGHLNIASDLDAILKAVKIVQERNKKIGFLVAGGGPDEQKFRDLAKKLGLRAIFTGHLSKEKTAEYLRQAGVCLVYYKEKEVNRYRCSMKIRECLAAGKKIVCNNFGDLKQFEEYTYQSPSDILDYSNKILEVIDGGDKRELEGADYIERNLDWDKIGSDFYKNIISA